MLDFHTPCIPCLIKAKAGAIRDRVVMRRLKAATGEDALPVYDNFGRHGYVFRSAMERVTADFNRKDAAGLFDEVEQHQVHHAYLVEVVSITNRGLMSHAGPLTDRIREANAELLVLPDGLEAELDDDEVDRLGGQA